MRLSKPIKDFNKFEVLCICRFLRNQFGLLDKKCDLQFVTCHFAEGKFCERKEVINWKGGDSMDGENKEGEGQEGQGNGAGEGQEQKQAGEGQEGGQHNGEGQEGQGEGGSGKEGGEQSGT